MAEASDTPSAPAAQREISQPPTMPPGDRRGDLLACTDGVSATRRNLLGAMAAAGVVGAAQAAAAAVDPHPAWEREVIARDAHMEAVSGAATDDEFDALNLERWEVVDQICCTPAATLAGITAQLRVVVTGMGKSSIPNETERDGLQNALASLERMVGRA